MKYRNIFKTMAEYNSSSLSYPNISLITDDNKVIVSNKRTQPKNEIWYTSTDGNIVEPYRSTNIGTLVSNTYEDGKGVMTFENDITSIGNNAFNNSDKLSSIIIPSGVTSIGNQAFVICTNLSSVTIPNSVTLFDTSAFLYCSNLQTINYDGTKEQFCSIEKGSYWNEGFPSDCIVHCTDGDFPITQFN